MRKEKTRELNKYIALAETQERQENSREFARFAGNGWFSVPFKDLQKIHNVTAEAIFKKERIAYCDISNRSEIKTFIDPLFKGIITLSFDKSSRYTTININIDYSALSDTEYKEMTDELRKRMK